MNHVAFNALGVVTLILSIAAVALAGWTLYRVDFAKEDGYDAVQRADAKVKICAAMDVVRRGVSVNTNLAPAGGPADVTGSQAVAANARVSLYDGGQYLLAKLDPATPTDLADDGPRLRQQPHGHRGQRDSGRAQRGSRSSGAAEGRRRGERHHHGVV